MLVLFAGNGKGDFGFLVGGVLDDIYKDNSPFHEESQIHTSGKRNYVYGNIHCCLIFFFFFFSPFIKIKQKTAAKLEGDAASS